MMAIAVVIPALDEEDRVAEAVASAFGDGVERTGSVPGDDRGPERTSKAPQNETSDPVSAGGRRAEIDADVRVDVVVVDGGSQDSTRRQARRAGARVIESLPGRGRQLDLGWRNTEADVVVFLHADTVLPKGWMTAVMDATQDAAVAGGAFRLGFDEPGARWRVLEWGVAARVWLLGLPYGDQAIFIRRDVLAAAGGVPDVAILEDLDLVRTIKRVGRLASLPLTVKTSTRRHRSGFLPTLSKHALALAGWRLGVDRTWLARRVRG